MTTVATSNKKSLYQAIQDGLEPFVRRHITMARFDEKRVLITEIMGRVDEAEAAIRRDYQAYVDAAEHQAGIVRAASERAVADYLERLARLRGAVDRLIEFAELVPVDAQIAQRRDNLVAQIRKDL